MYVCICVCIFHSLLKMLLISAFQTLDGISPNAYTDSQTLFQCFTVFKYSVCFTFLPKVGLLLSF